ncbi:MAG: hypothetical protein OQJ99_02320 [Rhodospirillales bacterium]|nr:hypothetical protein [Rhodospirillales bacterium]MCW8861100.1 hypothetical protein [Rhodospirillales bacterium]MCW9003572.1 hypothetical protein [Rhodospirillales bacterium]
MRFLDQIPLFPLALVAIAFGLAPFTPEPHLVEKTRMLMAGELVRLIDIFDFLFHGVPLLLLVVRLARAAITRA